MVRSTRFSASSPAKTRRLPQDSDEEMAPARRPDERIDPDVVLARSFAVGCGVLFGAFLLLWALVYLFWMG